MVIKDTSSGSIRLWDQWLLIPSMTAYVGYGRKRTCSKSSEMPQLSPSAKQGSKYNCGNYQGIFLLSTAGKILARVIFNYLRGTYQKPRVYSVQVKAQLTCSLPSVRCKRSAENKICICMQFSLTWPRCLILSTEWPYGWSFRNLVASESLWPWSACFITGQMHSGEEVFKNFEIFNAVQSLLCWCSQPCCQRHTGWNVHQE